MSRVIIIGIDAMDSEILARFESELPNLIRLRKQSGGVQLKSVFPPDTPTAWASAYTGLNPAKHGVIFFLDPLETLSIYATEDLDNTAIRGRTFWDEAGRNGKSVCVLLPQMGYPVWPVNGIMAAKTNRRYGNESPIQTYPESLAQDFDLRPLSSIKSLPKSRLFPGYVEDYRRLVSAEMDFGLRMWREREWDLFFIYSSALDWLGHNLWSYFDEGDPAYPGENRFSGLFLEFYKRYDEWVGKFLEEAGQDTAIVVFSDHGQMRRPLQLVNINELLRQEGLLAPRKGSGHAASPVSLLETAKKTAVKIVNRIGAGKLTMGIVHRVPAVRRIFTLPLSIDWEKTVAYVSDLSGVKAYPYGGIRIARDRLEGRDYEAVRDRILELLAAIKEPASEAPVAKWALRREDLYQGEYLDRYPDIVFGLSDQYGVGWTVNSPLFVPCQTHNIQPGSHRGDTPVIMFHLPSGETVIKEDATLMDIAPTVLHLMGIDGGAALDGACLLK
ncbi:MAG: alkaline phosphatase family protein [Dehalococcoidia bacterium]|nr:alkaline phosphatase family protein [Dehalococcoidia bacterium]